MQKHEVRDDPAKCLRNKRRSLSIRYIDTKYGRVTVETWSCRMIQSTEWFK